MPRWPPSTGCLCCCCSADTFAAAAPPLLQELELPDSGDVTVNDAFRPVSRYFDRIWRPEQLPAALMSAMRVLTNPAETGAVTSCFPQDVQARGSRLAGILVREASGTSRDRCPRGNAGGGRGRDPLGEEAADRRGRRRALFRATDALARFCEATGIPVGQSQAGKGT